MRSTWCTHPPRRGAVLGIQRKTSRTRSENHTTRLNSRRIPQVTFHNAQRTPTQPALSSASHLLRCIALFSDTRGPPLPCKPPPMRFLLFTSKTALPPLRTPSLSHSDRLPSRSNCSPPTNQSVIAAPKTSSGMHRTQPLPCPRAASFHSRPAKPPHTTHLGLEEAAA
ncbi:hypothetical protein ETH_00000540 [Eimeria tenella]|uniref:Uncharacterized protein n=1 Tax=Eimeria tenella TaxID=5802 RepID=U6L9K4_EIMTE|nr:hypothetical protein ETH_00000540 [Eimeria tenella]CDJ44425.1 hypothetical protein ETH_00000540 [Eimeria tenella]|eukprot:XP_013235174.1 hypothetical protein ETH_00000540 [Eimeria tenella]